MDELTEGTPFADGLVLHADERRVLGVLIEKSLATPEYYPMTLKALVAGCNQKSNRAPVSSYSEEDVLDALSELRSKRLVIAVKDSGSRSTRWRQELQRIFNLQGRELAVLAELLLRGPQTEGELRARASRMKSVEDLDVLRDVLQSLNERKPRFAERLTPEGVTRGVRFSHSLHPEEEMAQLRTEAEQGVPVETPVSAGTARAAEQTAQLEARMEALERRMTRIEESLGIEPD